MNQVLLSIISDKGEGIILREPASKYEKGRSSHLIKIKAIRNEVEALVVVRKKVNSTISLQLPNGHLIKIVSLDYVRRVKPGDIVTIKFDNHSQKNQPVTPAIHRIRRDVTWKDVLHGYSRDLQPKINLQELPQDVIGTSKRVRQGTNHRHHHRYVFESFAKQHHFKPLVAENWYPITRSLFATHTGAMGVLQHYKTFATALISVFRDVTFNESKFATKSTRHWHDLGRRKGFFDKYAKAKGFDPLIPENWYEIPKEAIQSEPDARSILNYYNMSVTAALIHLYPDIGLRKSGFARNVQYWDSAKNRRRLFDRIAEENMFDPLLPENWYSLSPKLFLAHKDAPIVLEKYRGNFTKALMDLYPDIGFQEHKFSRRKSHCYWKDMDNRRRVFDRLAREIGFDPLVPQNWYQLPRNDIVKDREAVAVLDRYKGSLINALVHVYPSVTFNELMINSKHSNDYWSESKNRRAFFMNIAAIMKFDPLVPSNWYSISKSTIKSYKNVNSVLNFYNGNHVRALIQLFPEVRFSQTNFAMERKKYWYNAQNRVLYFTTFAKENNFDPLIPGNWYTVSPAAAVKSHGGRGLLANYEGDLAKALIDTFPNISLRRKHFIYRKH